MESPKHCQPLNLPFVRQLEIAVDNDGCPVRAHLDFVLVSVRPRPTVRVLEVKSCTRLPGYTVRLLRSADVRTDFHAESLLEHSIL